MTRPLSRPRRGSIAPLTACLLVPLLAMVAFGVDTGWITHTHNELQSAADAAALAGAAQLTDDFVNYYLPNLPAEKQTALLDGAVAKAKAYARTYAGYNSAGDVSSLTLLDSDIELGYTDDKGKYRPLPAYKGYPNTVKVVLRRDASANGPLGLFFARVLGVSTVDLTATASACIYAGSVDDVDTSKLPARILPMTYDVNDWNRFLKGGPFPSYLSVDTDAAGLPRLAVYPSLKDRGNFGELSLDQNNDGSSTIRDWINNGVPRSDLQAEYNAGLLPLSQHDPKAEPDWKGNPGLKDSTIQAVGDHVGELYLLPLYQPVNPSVGNYQAGSGSGSNYAYTIVQFVGVRISAVDAGGTKAIKVQPSALIDPSFYYSSVFPASPPSGQSGLSTTFVGAKLVR